MINRFFAAIIVIFLFNSVYINDSFAQRSKSDFTLKPYLKLNSFGWKEFGDSGNELLTESGLLIGLGTAADYALTKKRNLFIGGDFQLYFGKVGYDGFLFNPQNGQQTPYNSNTGYFGLELSANSGYKAKISKIFIFTPIAGLGLEYWTRDLDDGGQYGYDEDYTAILFNLAAKGDYTAAKNLILFAMVMFKIPIALSEYVDASSRGLASPVDVNLNPGKGLRLYFEFGVNVSKLLFTGYVETWTLDKSPPDKTFHQPESTRTLFGLKMGYAFNM